MTHQEHPSTTLSRRALLASAGALGAIAAAPKAAQASETSSAHVHLASFEEYVAWANENYQPDPLGHMGSDAATLAFRGWRDHQWKETAEGKTFIDGNGRVFASPAVKVIDVSEHQRTIDWDAVKRSGVDAAILRCGYGIGNEDASFARNLRECERIGMPYGVYLFSYAYDAGFAAKEGGWTAELLKRYDAKPTLPVYYDLETWTWTGHKPPSDTKTYEAIVDAYFNAMDTAGFANVSIYSYAGLLLKGALKSPAIWKRTSWVAQYAAELEFDFKLYASDFHGWQYTDMGVVDGISGSVDINAFTPFNLYGFNDVTPATPHHEDIGWLKKQGITTGFPDGSFHGEANVTRQDMAALLYRTAGKPAYTPSKADLERFADITPATPHFKEICWLGSEGIAQGWTDRTYRGLNTVARQDMAAFLYRLAGSPSFAPGSDDVRRFADVTSATPHACEIWWLAGTGVTEGFHDGTFRGLAPVTRQDMAAFLHRLSTYLGGVFPR